MKLLLLVSFVLINLRKISLLVELLLTDRTHETARFRPTFFTYELTNNVNKM